MNSNSNLRKKLQTAAAVGAMTLVWCLMYFYADQLEIKNSFPDDSEPPSTEWDTSATSQLQLESLLKSGWQPINGRVVLPAGVSRVEATQFLRPDKITGLCFEGATIAAGDIRCLSDFPKLECLLFTRCELEKRGMAALPATISLRWLELFQSQCDDGDLVDVCDRFATSLRWLRVDSTPITDAGLEKIDKCDSLRLLDLSFTRVTPRVIPRLCGCRKLTRLYIILPKEQFPSTRFPELRRCLPGIRITSGDLQ